MFNDSVHSSGALPRVCYEIFVRSFCDSNRDGIGDINGVTQKLDYLQELGIEAIWLSPICKSPSYHKYDVTDYYQIDPEYGSIDDFKNLIIEAHRRNIKVIFDFVINHTSSKHHWFKEAKKGKVNPYRNFYNWLSPEEIKAKGIEIREKTADSWETKPWHWASKNDTEKYYGMFWSDMPDLNMDNPSVRAEIYSIGKYWLELGVDGFRMDAAKHIYPDWEVEKNHEFWKEFRAKMEGVNPEVYIVGEVWTSAEKIAPFFEGLKANFNFDLALTIQDLVRTGKDQTKLVCKLIESYALYAKVNPNFIDATMLGNHDQNRMGSIAKGDQEKLKMAANLLFTLPGNPFIYYGEELGMMGKKPDENIREAFLWDARFEDKDRTNWRKPKYNTDSKVKPLKFQKEEHSSLFNHYKNLIAIRKNIPALSQISPTNIKVSSISNENLISFIRPHEMGSVMVIQNIGAEKIQVGFAEKINNVIFCNNVDALSSNNIELGSNGLAIFYIEHKQ